jgi:hypothetical protein
MRVKSILEAVIRAALLGILGTVLTIAVSPESRADSVSYNFVGFVERSNLPDFTINQLITASFTLNTSIAGTPGPQVDQTTYSGAVTSFQFGSILLTPPYQNSRVTVTDGFYNGVGYVDIFFVQAILANGSQASMSTTGFGATSNPSFLTSQQIPTSLNFSLANGFDVDYLDGSGGEVVMGFNMVVPGVVPIPSTWTMLLPGLVGIGFLAYRRKSKPSLMAI